MSNIYEQDDSLSQYLLLHYGADRDVLPYDNGPEEALNYPVRCVQNLVDPASIGPGARALPGLHDERSFRGRRPG